MLVSTSSILNRPNPLPPESDTILPTVITGATVLLAFALITYILRIWLRLTRRGQTLGWDDGAITFALFLSFACYSIEVYITVITKGHHVYYISLDVLERISKASFVLIVLWVWVITMIKMSVCFMLLRIKGHSNPWRYGLGALMFVMVVVSVVTTISSFLMCNPVEANWELKYALAPGACWSIKTYVNFTYVIASIVAATDVILALLPIVFVRKINRPLHEKIMLCTLMGFGLLASVCGIIKMVLVEPALNSPDPVTAAVPAQMWAFGECYIGIFAANIPCLKFLFESLFRKVGEAITGIKSSKASKEQSSNEPDYEMSNGLKFDFPKSPELGYCSKVESVNGQQPWSDHFGPLPQDQPEKQSWPSSQVCYDATRNCYVTKEYEVLWSDPSRARAG